MKRFVFIIAASIAFSACNNAIINGSNPTRPSIQSIDRSNTGTLLRIANESLRLSLPRSAIVQYFPSTHPYYLQGKRISIMSMSPEEFSQNYDNQIARDFFVITIFQPYTRNATFDAWRTSLCNNAGQIKRSYYNEMKRYWLYDFYLSCNPLRNFAIVRDNEILRFEVGDDTRDYDMVWELLKKARFE